MKHLLGTRGSYINTLGKFRVFIYVFAKLGYPIILVLVTADEKVYFYRTYPNLLEYCTSATKNIVLAY